MAASCHAPVWITAERQTAGRGRRGRAWASPEGALAATLLIRPAEPAGTAALRSFVAAVALAEAFETLGAPAGAVTAKWPNDVLLHGCKAAGILLESASAGAGGGLAWMAIGIGINLSGAPDAALIEAGAVPPASLAEVLGRPVDREEMMIALARAYAAREAEFVAQGFAPIRSRWLARAARLGAPIRARTARETLDGIFDTVDETGHLLLRNGDGLHRIPAADVFF
ncbi:biotin--[acetyl-CoA-carboxylase] ligase [Mangrovicoccus sp. HB182678]|uniref:biotin--[biotin carboxyl-carrier protein] ligase n=2 Tax=Mangrovicoccus algicola TaxID=2771008 RepID=A0A8J7CVG9_9RHOB|nr:biotin--[acetyl-CoA-carboxylase] ligase [Mangrovicoccus algicola]